MAQPQPYEFLVVPIRGTDLVAIYRNGRKYYVKWSVFLTILKQEIQGGSSFIVGVANTSSINLSVSPTGILSAALTAIGSAGTYGDSTNVPRFTVDSQGRITGVTLVPITAGSGTVTSVALQLPNPTSPAFSVTGSPITGAGTFVISANGTTAQYVRGDGSLATFPSIPSGTVTSVSASVPAPTSPAFSVNVSNPSTTPDIAITANGTTSQVVLGDGSLGTINSYFKAEYTASGAASLDIPIPSGYNKIEITISGVYTSVINAELWIRAGTGSPVVYASGASNYSHYRIGGQSGGAPSGAGSLADTKIVYLGAASTNTSSRTMNGTIYLNSPDDTSMLKQIQYKFSGWLSGGQLYTTDGTGSYILTNDAITGIRLLASSGNISGKAVIRAWP